MATIKERLEKIVKELDPKLKKSDKSFETAVILLAGAKYGADASVISKKLKIPLKRIQEREKNLRENGIWKKDRTYCEWMHKKTGGVAFWCDVCVTDGMLRRTL